MSIKLMFRKAGKRGCREIDSDELLKGVLEVSIYSCEFKLHKLKGRPKTILHEWVFRETCKNKGVNLDEIMEYTEGTREEILGEWHGKEYIVSDSWEELYKEMKLKGIPTPYGD